MFFRTKTSGPRSYLQIVENRWEDGRPRQRVIATLGRLDHLQQTGQLDALLVSGARLAQSVLLLSAIPGQPYCKEKTRGFRNWSSQTLVQYIFRLIGLQ